MPRVVSTQGSFTWSSFSTVARVNESVSVNQSLSRSVVLFPACRLKNLHRPQKQRGKSWLCPAPSSPPPPCTPLKCFFVTLFCHSIPTQVVMPSRAEPSFAKMPPSTPGTGPLLCLVLAKFLHPFTQPVMVCY